MHVRPEKQQATAPGLVRHLQCIVGEDAVLYKPFDLMVYECDAYTIEKAAPQAVVFPTETEQVQQVVQLCNRLGIPFVPRGAGTGLSGGALAVKGGVVICTSRMTRIIEVDIPNRRITAQAGAINLDLTKAVKAYGYHYAPDPSSQGVSTIGGNVAENAGGPHTLKYGVTVNHVTGLEVVLPDGEVAWFGGKCEESLGYDLVGVFTGSEGTLGVLTTVIAKLTPLPQGWRTLLAVYPRLEDACQTVSDIIAAGIVPAAMEMIDRTTLQAVEEAFHFGFPQDADAVLVIELDGLEAALDRQLQRVIDICHAHHAEQIRLAHDEDERTRLWTARKKAVGSLGRLAPSTVTQDTVVPRSKLPQALRSIMQIGQEYGVRIANVFHAGDGSLHPIVLFDERDAEQVRRVRAANDAIVRLCIQMGGSITGEHGVGVEKAHYMRLLYNDSDLKAMQKVHNAFDPLDLCNPDKILPCNDSGQQSNLPR
ncbi:MAG: FAD-linked oxidase C-terminal domain-containing protein [Armatimonadota bacterium]|nr:FAD-binding protein [bacterium]MDW8321179.1 FAD-linked oxidase C-terminal domain-containing protein [Armatimonadota bacterium]